MLIKMIEYQRPYSGTPKFWKLQFLLYWGPTVSRCCPNFQPSTSAGPLAERTSGAALMDSSGFKGMLHVNINTIYIYVYICYRCPHIWASWVEF